MVLNIKKNKIIRNKEFIRTTNKKVKSYIKNPKGGLDLSFAPIHVLPDSIIQVNGDLNISYSKIHVLPPNLNTINGTLDIMGTDIDVLPNNLIINGHLFLMDNNLIALNQNIKIKGEIFMQFDNYKIDNYYICNTIVQRNQIRNFLKNMFNTRINMYDCFKY